MKIRPGIVFPLVLALALGGMSAWLGRISEIAVEETVLNPNEPQYTMQTVEGIRFDDTGFINQKLTAESAWQFPDKKEVFLRTPDLSLLQQDTELYHASGRQGRYHTDNRTAVLEGGVVLTKAADAEHPAGVLYTERLTVDTVSRNAYTDLPVRYRYGQSEGSSEGFRYNYRDRLLNLPSRVKALIYDPKNIR